MTPCALLLVVWLVWTGPSLQMPPLGASRLLCHTPVWSSFPGPSTSSERRGLRRAPWLAGVALGTAALAVSSPSLGITSGAAFPLFTCLVPAPGGRIFPLELPTGPVHPPSQLCSWIDMGPHGSNSASPFSLHLECSGNQEDIHIPA